MIRFILLLALLTAFPPLATDMYLPAIPHLVEIWQQPLFTVNLTLVLFFVTYCVSLLVYGPLSDRFGRKPPLLTGLLLFILASLLCAFSVNIWMLIGARIIQATMIFSYFIFGALAMLAVSLDWADTITFIGRLSAASGIIALSLWFLLKKHLHVTVNGD